MQCCLVNVAAVRLWNLTALGILKFSDHTVAMRPGRQDSPARYVYLLRGSVSTPQSLRLFDPTDYQKPTLIPLRLGPVVLRDLPSAKHEILSIETSPRSVSTADQSFYTYSPRSDSEYLEPRDAPTPRSLHKTSPRISSMSGESGRVMKPKLKRSCSHQSQIQSYSSYTG